MTVNPLFNEAIYLAENPDVPKAVAEEKYASGYDEYLQSGQFLERKGVIFNGTTGNDTIQASGQTSSVIGVPVKTATVGSRLINAETESLGVGEIDILAGSPGRNIFYLGNNAEKNSSDFYLGNGDQDYARIRYFDPTSEDAIYLSGTPEDYKLETIDGSVHISKNNDLLGIVEGAPKLIPDGLFTENGLLLFAPSNDFFAKNSQSYFNQPAYLAANPDVQALIDSKKYATAWDHFINVGIDEGRQTFFNGVVGNDSFFYALGNATVVGFPITEYDPATGAIKTATTGVGERDHYHGSYGANRFLLGNAGQDFYLGNGDKDYVLIGDFDPRKDQLIVANSIENYKFDVYDDEFQGVVYKEFQISTQDGDVIARIEDPDLKLVQIASDIPGTYALVSVEYEGLKLPAEPNLSSEPIFGKIGNDVLNVDKSGQIVFAGTGNDLIEATASLGNNRIYGGVGDDTFILGQGDNLFGGAGNDRFFATSGGVNVLTGGAGSDQFWVATAEIPNSANTIADFTKGEDVIGFAGIGASFNALRIIQQDQNTLISYNGNSLAVLNNVQALSLGSADFAFA